VTNVALMVLQSDNLARGFDRLPTQGNVNKIKWFGEMAEWLKALVC
jgi:hypothetical protein